MKDRDVIVISGEEFERNIPHFSFQFKYDKVYDMAELAKMKEFTQLQSASFNSTNFNDIGIKQIAKNCKSIENLNLQDTQISDTGIKYLSRLKSLKFLRLKENEQLTNKCIDGLNLCENLIDLQIHETSIDDHGIKKLNLPNLTNLLVNEGNKDILLNLSLKLSQCSILVKGRMEVLNGKILWKR